MITTTINLTLLFLTSFNGSFEGIGEAVFATGKRYQCHEIFLALKTDPAFFQLREGGYRCGELLNASFDPFKMNIKNGGLFHQGLKLGSISENELEYEIHDPQDGSTYHLKLNKTGQSIHYLEEWHDGQKVALTVKGILSPLKNRPLP